MLKEGFITLCTRQADAAHMGQLEDFLKRYRKRNRMEIPGALKKMCLTELGVFLLFRLLTQIPCKELFFSMYPVLLMVFIFYAVAISALIGQGIFYEKKLKRLVHQPGTVCYAPGDYIFMEEKGTRVGNDVSSPVIRSAVFSHPAFPENVSASLKSTGFFFDLLEEGKEYTLFSIDGRYIMFIKKYWQGNDKRGLD